MSESAHLRDAASLLLLQDAGADIRVLMGMRSAGHRFLPNHLVFPGGGVDADDHTAPLADTPDPTFLTRLGAGDPTFGRALAHAAARELEEETGLTLGTPPSIAGLAYLCRAITPEGRPVRFDARFLVGDHSLAQGSLAGSGELENLTWYGVTDALALDLAYATRKVLEQLVDWLALPEADRFAPRPTPTLRDRTWHLE